MTTDKIFYIYDGLATFKFKCKYDYVYSYFENGFARILLNDKYGFINKNGIEIIKPIYDYYEADKLLKQYIINRDKILKLNLILWN
jgi:hypothetical protein